MTVIDGHDRWARPYWASNRKTHDKRAGRGPILLAVVAGCVVFWALVGFVIVQI